MTMFTTSLALGAVFVAGVAVGCLAGPADVLHAQGGRRVFELRTYTAPEGKLADLQALFRGHTTRLFEKHGITSVWYWVPQEAPRSSTTLIYIVAHPSREEATMRWAAFQADPEWQKVRADAQVNGRLTTEVKSVFLDPTDFSPLK